MGFLKDFFWDDKPCLIIRKITIDDEPKKVQQNVLCPSIDYDNELEDKRTIQKLLKENKQLKKQLVMKKVNAIEVENVVKT